MSLSSAVNDLATRIASEFKAVRVEIANSGGGGGAETNYIGLTGSHGAVSFTNQPAALTEWNNATRTRVKVNLTNATQARVSASVSTSGFSGSTVAVQYATDGDAQNNWGFLDGSSGPSAPIDSGGGNVGTWITLVAGARADVWVRLVALGGDGTVDPIVGNVVLQTK